jgi:GTPase SAR1 family protein
MTSTLPDDVNPFATRYTRPGELPYVFDNAGSAGSLEQLAERLAAQRFRAQLIGPHGSGKTTLLLALLPRLPSAGQPVHFIRLQQGQRRLPCRLSELKLADGTLIVVDGYDQLSGWARCRLTWQCRRRGWGLLVTTHRRLWGFPVLASLRTSLETALQLVRRLQPAADPSSPLITDSDVRACFARQDGNLRETLFALYDLFEQRRRREPADEPTR